MAISCACRRSSCSSLYIFLVHHASFSWQKYKPKAPNSLRKISWKQFINNNNSKIILCRKDIILELRKLANFQIFGKIFDEICTFSGKKKYHFWRSQNPLEPIHLALKSVIWLLESSRDAQGLGSFLCTNLIPSAFGVIIKRTTETDWLNRSIDHWLIGRQCQH